MTQAEREQFARICEEEANREPIKQGIGTYMEKRLHRVLKHYFSEPEGQTEVSVGPYVADIQAGNRIIEIQTGSFRPLALKIRYYLEHTEYDVTVVYPILSPHLLIRMDRETGEVLRKRRSSRQGKPVDLLSELYWLRELIPNGRLTVLVLSVGADEFRYSERMRYRREGAYDAELFPRELTDLLALREREDYAAFLPPQMSFTAAEYAAWTKLTSRRANFALQTLCGMELLEREKIGKKYLYHKK